MIRLVKEVPVQKCFTYVGTVAARMSILITVQPLENRLKSVQRICSKIFSLRSTIYKSLFSFRLFSQNEPKDRNLEKNPKSHESYLSTVPKFHHLISLDLMQKESYILKFRSSLTENSSVSGASLKKAEIFFGYFDIFSHLKWILEKQRVCMKFCFSIIIWNGADLVHQN